LRQTESGKRASLSLHGRSLMQREWTEAIGGVYSCIKEHPLSRTLVMLREHTRIVPGDKSHACMRGCMCIIHQLLWALQCAELTLRSLPKATCSHRRGVSLAGHCCLRVTIRARQLRKSSAGNADENKSLSSPSSLKCVWVAIWVN
jgi:hypothetical protein